jgi:lipopolysaccharide transport system permease protein
MSSTPATTDSVASWPVHRIAASTRWAPLNLGEIWSYRELLYLLIWREVKVRYKQTVLGLAWAIAQPLFTMIVFSVFFGHFAKMPSDGLPYPVFAYAALLPWQLFAFSLTESSGSVVANQRLITKVYFPRIIIPLATIGVGLVDFAVSLVILAAMLAYYGAAPHAGLWAVPAFILLAVATAFGVGLWLSALNVRYRDVRYTLAFLTQIWLLATPVAYSSTIVPARWRAIYALNPMVGVIEGFRWALFGVGDAPGVMVGVSAGVVATVLVTGLFYFRRMERTFADVI